MVTTHHCHKGVPPHWRHPRFDGLLELVHQTWTLFFTPFFDYNFPPNNNQTFIVYAKSTLVLVRKGLCGFFIFGICPRRKVTWSKVLQVLRTRGSIILHKYVFMTLSIRHSNFLCYSLWSLILASLFWNCWNFLCDLHRTCRFCTRVVPAISEYHPIDEYTLQST